MRIALDDFGTAYSSLSHLHRFPHHILKIDPRLITDIARHRADAPIVTAVTDVAHALGVMVTAEGVETNDQHQRVVEIGCDHAQPSTAPVPSVVSISEHS